MDLCLPKRWMQHPQALQRDDLGHIPPPPRPVCGLRDWRKRPLTGSETAPRKLPETGKPESAAAFASAYPH